MKKNIFKLFVIFLIILLSIFVGYENPEIAETFKGLVRFPQKYYNYVFKNNLPTEKIDKNKLTTYENEQFSEIESNSFSVKIAKVKSFPGKSAGVFMSQNENLEIVYQIFTQDGLLIKKNDISDVILPLFFYGKKNGGIKTVFSLDNKYFALVSSKKLYCFYASVISLHDSKELLRSKCLPDIKNADYNGLGGAFIKGGDNVLLSVGTPGYNSDLINELAQLDQFIFGKILSIKFSSLLNPKNDKIDYTIFSKGHRNPQGLVINDDIIFSLEHGPYGGDELNEIIEGKNYGWPIVSLGTRYNDGKSYFRSHIEHNFEEPIFTFSPSVAPSSLNICPNNLSKYYQNYNCLMGLSLRGMSILIFLLDISLIVLLSDGEVSYT